MKDKTIKEGIKEALKEMLEDAINDLKPKEIEVIFEKCELRAVLVVDGETDESSFKFTTKEDLETALNFFKRFHETVTDEEIQLAKFSTRVIFPFKG